MVNRILCYLNIHTGKFDQGKRGTEQTFTKAGDKYEKYYLRQTRYCTECGAMELKETQVGYQNSPKWYGDDVASNDP